MPPQSNKISPFLGIEAMAIFPAATMHQPIPIYSAIESFEYLLKSIAVNTTPTAQSAHIAAKIPHPQTEEYSLIGQSAMGV